MEYFLPVVVKACAFVMLLFAAVVVVMLLLKTVVVVALAVGVVVASCITTKKLITRLHSSRMHTTRSLTVSPSMHCSGGVCSWRVGVPGPGGCLDPRGMPGPHGGAWSPGVPGPRGVPGLGGGLSQHALRQNPPVNRMTDRCKNITLPQTSFAGGNRRKSCFD